jgi:hypothetical protein
MMFPVAVSPHACILLCFLKKSEKRKKKVGKKTKEKKRTWKYM